MKRQPVPQLLHLRAAQGEPLEDIPTSREVDASKKIETITFRIPHILKRRVEEVAERRAMSLVQVVIEALEFEVEEEPPRWFVNYLEGRKPKRTAFTVPKKDCRRKAKAFVVTNPRGVRTSEVAQITGQTVESAYNTLVALADDKEIVRHGARKHRLWTAVGVVPISRVESIEAAICKVLADAAGAPVDQITLQDAAAQLYEKSTGKTLRIESLVTVIHKTMRKGVIKKAGANGRGVLYLLAPQKKKGGASTALAAIQSP